MSGPNGETLIVLPMKPRGAEYVRCPTCGLVGWRDDGGPMFCPDDLTEAVTLESEPEPVVVSEKNPAPTSEEAQK